MENKGKIKFEQIPQDKQQLIISAALKEFAINGYDRGSTNSIVKEAGISKGLIFHYFGNKESLYFYLLDYCVTYLSKEVYGEMIEMNMDFLEWFREETKIECEIYQKHPHLSKFIHKAFRETNVPIKEKIMAYYAMKSVPIIKDIQGSLDYSKLREGIDTQMAFTTVMNTFEKMTFEAFEQESFDIKDLMIEIESYLEFFEKVFYK